MEKFLTPKDASAIVSLDEKTIRRALGEGRLKGSFICGRWRVKPDDLAKWIDGGSNESTVRLAEKSARIDRRGTRRGTSARSTARRKQHRLD